MPPTVTPYRRELAVAYAHAWAFGRNPRYYDFEKLGGDCTNFASQCLYAGTSVMDFTPTFGWYYRTANHKAPAWTGVDYLYRYLTRKEKRPGPFGVRVQMDRAEPGDLAQLSFRQGVFSHTPVIVSVGDPPTLEHILIAAHTYDADFRPLSTYQVNDIRFLHIEGVYR